MAAGLFTNPPTTTSVGQLFIYGCDSNGDEIEPDLTWNCAQGDYPANQALIETNQALVNACQVTFQCVDVTRTSGTNVVITSARAFTFGTVTNAVSSSESVGVAGTSFEIYNATVKMTGTAYSRGISSYLSLNNVRIVGNPAASSGIRVGVQANTNALHVVPGPLCVVGCLVGGVNNSTGANSGMGANRCTIVNCTTGLRTDAATSGGTSTIVSNANMIANCTTGLSQNFGRYIGTKTRLRNTSNFANTSVFPSTGFLTASGNDADEFVDAANGDYRIKNTSIYWGRGIGAGDEPAAGGIPIGRLISGGV
jgi:hypothetical protein